MVLYFLNFNENLNRLLAPNVRKFHLNVVEIKTHIIRNQTKQKFIVMAW